MLILLIYWTTVGEAARAFGLRIWGRGEEEEEEEEEVDRGQSGGQLNSYKADKTIGDVTAILFHVK